MGNYKLTTTKVIFRIKDPKTNKIEFEGDFSYQEIYIYKNKENKTEQSIQFNIDEINHQGGIDIFFTTTKDREIEEFIEILKQLI